MCAFKRKYFLNDNYFENIDNEEKAYWLGFISADGCVRIIQKKKKNGEFGKQSYVFSMQLAKKDKIHLEKLLKALNSTHKIFYCEKNQSYGIAICSKIFCIHLINQGIIPKKSLILKPNKNISYDLKKHFIRGYFDGDGCISIPNNNPIKVNLKILGTKEILEWIKDYSLQNNLNFLTFKKRNNIFSLECQGRIKGQKFYQIFIEHSNVFLERKKEKFDKIFKEYSFKDNRKKIQKLDVHNNVTVYNSITEAENENNIYPDDLRKVLKRENKKYKNCTWSYA